MQKIKLSTDIKNKIILTYLSGKDTYQTAIDCNCSQTFVMNILKQNNIARRTTQSYTTKYITNENFFDKINSEEKAYILGFLYADGNNYIKATHSYEISIALQEEDKYILEKIKNFLSPQSSLKYIKFKNKNWKNQFLLRINSKKLSEQLTNLGCVPAKSLILSFPNFIEEKLLNHFIRGYFDGDGSLYSKKPSHTGHMDWIWQITSTKIFCQSVKNIIEHTINVHCSQLLSCPKTNKITTTLSIGGNLQVRKVLDWLYQDATIYLPRKYKKYLKFINN